MKELIKIEKNKIKEEEEEILTVNAEELHGYLEVKTKFNDWFERRIKEYKFVVNTDFCSFLSKTLGRPKTEYHITLDMAKELCMVERNEKGKEARQYFIECEKELKESKKEISSMSEMQMIARIALSMDKQQKELEEHNNRIEKIEKYQERKADVTKLLPEVPPITNRNNLSKIVREYCHSSGTSYQDAWHEVYREFLYTYRLNISLRAKNKNMTKIDYAEKFGYIKKLTAIAIKLFT